MEIRGYKCITLGVEKASVFAEALDRNVYRSTPKKAPATTVDSFTSPYKDFFFRVSRKSMKYPQI